MHRIPKGTDGQLDSFLKRRELPGNILTNELMAKFEEAAGVKDGSSQKEQLAALVAQLPKCNAVLLGWLMAHMEHVVRQERHTKMNVQNLSIVLTPTLNLSPRVLNALLVHARALFADTKIIRLVEILTDVSKSISQIHRF